MVKREELPTPEEIRGDDRAEELLRVWRANDGMIYASWEDETEVEVSFGQILAAAARIVAGTVTPLTKPGYTLGEIRQAFMGGTREVELGKDERVPKLGAYNEIVTLFHGETDRAAGILSAAWLDNHLAGCLRYFVIDDPEAAKLIGSEKEFDKPLTPFKVRARALYVLGLISKGALKDLDLIVKIRNHFAHHPAVTSFDEQRVKDWCGSLRPALARMGSTARDFYLLAMGVVVVELHQAMSETEPRQVRPDRVLPVMS
jgi:hypothetical protein